MDFGAFAEWLKYMATEYDLQGICYDKWRIDELKRELGHHEISANEEGLWIAGKFIPMVAHPQGYVNHGAEGLSMPISIDTVESKLHKRVLIVKANPALRSAALGAVAPPDQRLNRSFLKMKSKTRIDPMVAAAMAVGYATSMDPPDWDDDAFKVHGV